MNSVVLTVCSLFLLFTGESPVMKTQDNDKSDSARIVVENQNVACDSTQNELPVNIFQESKLPQPAMLPISFDSLDHKSVNVAKLPRPSTPPPPPGY
jgi:hypothetical protein